MWWRIAVYTKLSYWLIMMWVFLLSIQAVVVVCTCEQAKVAIPSATTDAACSSQMLLTLSPSRRHLPLPVRWWFTFFFLLLMITICIPWQALAGSLLVWSHVGTCVTTPFWMYLCKHFSVITSWLSVNSLEAIAIHGEHTIQKWCCKWTRFHQGRIRTGTRVRACNSNSL